MEVRKFIKIYSINIKASLAAALEYRANFLIDIFSEMLWTIMYWVFVEVLVMQFETIAGWDRFELLFLYGLTRIIRKLSASFVTHNIIDIPGIIHRGELDHHLLRPYPVLLTLILRAISFSNLFGALPGFIIMFYALANLNLSFEPVKTIFAFFIIILSQITYFAIQIIFISLSFWWGDISHGTYMFEELTKIGQLPPNAFSGFSKFFFGYVIPIIFFAAIPAAIIFDKMDPLEALWLIPVCIFWVGFATIFWKIGVASYTSAN